MGKYVQVMDEVERFSRRTISVCQDPPDLSSLPAVSEDAISETESAPQPQSYVKEDRDDELSISWVEHRESEACGSK